MARTVVDAVIDEWIADNIAQIAEKWHIEIVPLTDGSGYVQWAAETASYWTVDEDDILDAEEYLGTEEGYSRWCAHSTSHEVRLCSVCESSGILTIAGDGLCPECRAQAELDEADDDGDNGDNGDPGVGPGSHYY